MDKVLGGSGVGQRGRALLLTLGVALLGGCASPARDPEPSTANARQTDAQILQANASAMQAAGAKLEVDPNASPDEQEYMRRYIQLAESARAGLGLVGYDPMEPVAGAQDYAPLPRGSGEARFDPAALAAVDEYVGKMNSSALIVWSGGKVVFERYYGDHSADALVVSRSLAKPVTVLAIARAIQLGKIKSLDQPVADFIIEWQGTDKAAILVRHLLDMRTGLLPQGAAIEPENILNRAYLHPRHDEIIINEYPLTHVPGSRYEYSNATSELVAPLIERATGVRYGTWVSEQVLKPIGAAGGEVWVNRVGGTAHSGCCILLPAETYLRMAVLLKRDGVWDGNRLLPEGFVKAATTPTPQNAYTGMGLYVSGPYIERRGYANPETMAEGKTLHSEPYLAGDLFLYDGNGNQVVYVIPSLDLVVLRTGNRAPRGSEWDNALVPNTLIRGIRLQPGESLPAPQPRD